MQCDCSKANLIPKMAYWYITCYDVSCIFYFFFTSWIIFFKLNQYMYSNILEILVINTCSKINMFWVKPWRKIVHKSDYVLCGYISYWRWKPVTLKTLMATKKGQIESVIENLQNEWEKKQNLAVRFVTGNYNLETKLEVWLKFWNS